MDMTSFTHTQFETKRNTLNMTTTLSQKQQDFIDLAIAEGYTSPMTRKDMQDLRANHGAPLPAWIMKDDARRIGRGLYNVPELTGGTAPRHTPAPATVPVAVEAVAVAAPAIKTVDSAPTVSGDAMYAAMQGTQKLIPNKIGTYVPYGHFKTFETIIKTGVFYPVFITGLSGNGKTTLVEQVCAKLKREYFRVNITRQTEEDDLLGGFRLIDGNTVWQDGPVVAAMKRGAVLLVDEIDLGGPNVMCLQSILEGKGVFLKKINQFVSPAAGFNVVATANTKGKGSEDGRFAGTNILNEAFLDRFEATLEQDYPSRAVEKKIIIKNMDVYGRRDDEFADCLTKWAEIIRKTFHEGGVDEIISTRRLKGICQSFAIFGDKMKSIGLAISRFDDDTKESFLNLYTKVDGDIETGEDDSAEETVAASDNSCPF
jgi:MoxR-like ATPase